MKDAVLITGGHSFIAGHLIPLLENNYQVKLLTRTPNADNEYAWDVEKRTMDERALDDVQYIVHLAGAKLNDGTPLTDVRKRLIRDTRIGAANFLRSKLKDRGQKLKAFVSASAIGYYGFSDRTLEIDEDGEIGSGFSAELCRDWEIAADFYKTDGIAEHVSKIRVALTLGNNGGIFPMYKDVVKNHPLAVLQPQPGIFLWNHIDDMAGIFAYAIDKKLNGVFNSVAPQPASTQDVLKAISNQMLNTNYQIDPFSGQHLVSYKIMNEGYEFKYPDITSAVRNLFAK